MHSKQWEAIDLEVWRGGPVVEFNAAASTSSRHDYDADHLLIKQELMPDGRKKVILRERHTGEISERFE